MNVRDIKKVYKIDKQMVLEKRSTADRSLAAVTIEERIGWVLLWEMALDCGEKHVRKIQWLAWALCYRFLEKIAPTHVTILHNRGFTELLVHKFAVLPEVNQT